MVIRARQQVQIAEVEVNAAKAEVDAAKARVAACKQAVALAKQSVAVASEAIERSVQGINASERSLEYAASAETQVGLGREQAITEQEKANYVVVEALTCINLTEEAAGQLHMADDLEEKSREMSENAQREIDRKISILYEMDAPTLNSSPVSSTVGASQGPSHSTCSRQIHYHHIYPQQQKLREFFESKGIDIDQWTVAVDEKTHLKFIHSETQWNNVWDAWIKEHQDENPTTDEVLKFGREMLSSFGLESLWEGGADVTTR